MSKAEEKTTELMKKAKDFIPNGGYSEKELNLAFYMFNKGYHQAEKDMELSLEDVYDIWRLYNEVCSEGQIFGHDETSEEVLKRFKAQKEI